MFNCTGNVIVIKNALSNKLVQDFVHPTLSYNVKSTTTITKSKLGESSYNSAQISHEKQLNEYLNVDSINTQHKINQENEERNKKIVQPIGSNFEYD